MSVNSHTPGVVFEVIEEYGRYERYLTIAYAIVSLVIVSLLCPRSLWGVCLALIVVIAAAFRKYHVVVHRFVGSPTARADRDVQLWGTAAQAVVWAALPLMVATCLVQIFS